MTSLQTTQEWSKQNKLQRQRKSSIFITDALYVWCLFVTVVPLRECCREMKG